jgi:hypothetical protein
MPYQLLQIDDTNAFLLQAEDDPTNALVITDLRDLLLLRARLDQFTSNLATDGTVANHPMPEPHADDTISVAQAISIASRTGYNLPPTTLKSAVYRGTIKGSYQQGTRWRIPRQAFEEWFQGWIAQQS